MVTFTKITLHGGKLVLFCNDILKIIQEAIPSKVVSGLNHLPWISVWLKHLIRKSSLCTIEPKDTEDKLTGMNLNLYIHHQVHAILKKNCQNYLTECISSDSKLNRNKPFWRYVQSRTQEHPSISVLQTPSGMAITTHDKLS